MVKPQPRTPNLSFDPPLNWKTQLRTATPLEAKYVELTFRVTVSMPPAPTLEHLPVPVEDKTVDAKSESDGEIGEAKEKDVKEGIKAKEEEKEADDSYEIQVWTNATPKGEWLAIPFKAPPKENELPNGPHILNLSSTASLSSPISTPEQIELSAPLRIANDTSHRFTYSYTYRLVYASGRIEWLGAFGSDGKFEIIPEGLDYFNEGYGWIETFGREGPTGKVFTVGQSVAAGSFNVRGVGWSGWSISSTK